MTIEELSKQYAKELVDGHFKNIDVISSKIKNLRSNDKPLSIELKNKLLNEILEELRKYRGGLKSGLEAEQYKILLENTDADAMQDLINQLAAAIGC